MNRAEHLEWAKKRAIEYVEAGNGDDAWASMVSDLQKHDKLANHPGIELGILLILGGHLNSLEEIKRHIEGFN